MLRAGFGNLLIQRNVIVVFLLHLLLLRKDFRHRFAVLAFHAPNQIQPCLNFLRPNGVELPFFSQIRQFVADFLQLIVRRIAPLRQTDVAFAERCQRPKRIRRFLHARKYRLAVIVR